MSCRFPDGAVVRVKALFPPGHCRTPHYTRGRCGTVLGGLPRLPVYRVRFACSELWPDPPAAAADAVVVDLFEPWLEPAAGELS